MSDQEDLGSETMSASQPEESHPEDLEDLLSQDCSREGSDINSQLSEDDDGLSC